MYVPTSCTVKKVVVEKIDLNFICKLNVPMLIKCEFIRSVIKKYAVFVFG